MRGWSDPVSAGNGIVLIKNKLVVASDVGIAGNSGGHECHTVSFLRAHRLTNETGAQRTLEFLRLVESDFTAAIKQRDPRAGTRAALKSISITTAGKIPMHLRTADYPPGCW